MNKTTSIAHAVGRSLASIYKRWLALESICMRRLPGKVALTLKVVVRLCLLGAFAYFALVPLLVVSALVYGCVLISRAGGLDPNAVPPLDLNGKYEIGPDGLGNYRDGVRIY